MPVFNNRCPSCGGKIIIAPGQNYGVCEYCDNSFTLSRSEILEDAGRTSAHNETDADQGKTSKCEDAFPVESIANSSIEDICEKAKAALNLELWNVVYDHCDEIISRDPRFGEAYLYKMLADLKLCRKEELLSLSVPFDNNKNYKLLMRAGDDCLKSEIQNYSNTLKNNLNARVMEERYNELTREMESAKGAAHFKYLANSFLLLQGYKDSAERCIKCKEKYEIQKKKNIRIAISVLLILAIIAFIFITSVSCAVSNAISQYDSDRFGFKITSKRNDEYDSSYVYLIFDYTIFSDSNHAIDYFCGYMTIKNKNGQVLTHGEIKLHCSVAPEGEYTGAIRWRMPNDNYAEELWYMDYSELEIYFRITRIEFENGNVKTYENQDKIIKRLSH